MAHIHQNLTVCRRHWGHAHQLRNTVYKRGADLVHIVCHSVLWIWKGNTLFTKHFPHHLKSCSTLNFKGKIQFIWSWFVYIIQCCLKKLMCKRLFISSLKSFSLPRRTKNQTVFTKGKQSKVMKKFKKPKFVSKAWTQLRSRRLEDLLPHLEKCDPESTAWPSGRSWSLTELSRAALCLLQPISLLMMLSTKAHILSLVFSFLFMLFLSEGIKAPRLLFLPQSDGSCLK